MQYMWMLIIMPRLNIRILKFMKNWLKIELIATPLLDSIEFFHLFHGNITTFSGKINYHSNTINIRKNLNKRCCHLGHQHCIFLKSHCLIFVGHHKSCGICLEDASQHFPLVFLSSLKAHVCIFVINDSFFTGVKNRFKFLIRSIFFDNVSR